MAYGGICLFRIFQSLVFVTDFIKNMGLIMCSKKKINSCSWTHNLSQAEKEITAYKAEEIKKMTAIFTQNNNQEPSRVKLVVILCHFS